MDYGLTKRAAVQAAAHLLREDRMIVPQEPTHEMIEAAKLETGLDEETIQRIYAIMMENAD